MQGLETCSECGQKKECFSFRFAKLLGTTKAIRVTDLNYTMVDNSSNITCAMCGDCIGPVETKGHIWLFSILLATVALFAYCIIYNPIMSPLGMPLLFPVWLLNGITVAIGLILLSNDRENRKKAMMAALIGIFLGWTQIPTLVLLIKFGKIKHNMRENKLSRLAQQRLTEKATSIFTGQKEQTDSIIARAQESGAESLSEEEKKLFAQAQKAKSRSEESAKWAQEETRTRKHSGAIIGILITIGLAIWGFSTYSEGGYMQWLGIKMSSGGFLALIGAFLVYDVIAIVSARKKKWAPRFIKSITCMVTGEDGHGSA